MDMPEDDGSGLTIMATTPGFAKLLAQWRTDGTMARYIAEGELERLANLNPTPLAQDAVQSSKNLKRFSTRGYVYLLQSPTTAYKIGRAVDPKNRLATFSVSLPFEVEFIALIPTEDMYTLERQLHARYADKRVNGEWFNLALDDVEYIKSLAVQV